MRYARSSVLWLAFLCTALAVPNASAELIPSPDGLTVYDTVLQVTWLANANLAATPAGQFGIPNVTPNGSMDYPTAVQWVAAMNGLNGGVGYLGHNTWTLPSSPTYPDLDTSCSTHNYSGGGSFGYGCLHSAMGSLFTGSLGLSYPNTAVPIPSDAVGPFSNVQPYLYWSDTSTGGKGFSTFSFNTGWEGSNVDGHYMYVLPMLQGKPQGVTYTATGTGTLQVSADLQTVYDPVADVTWLADADLAKSQTFGAQCVNPDGTQCVNPDGSMTHTTALAWIDGMNAYGGGSGWLGHHHWTLPPIPSSPVDPNCSIQQGGPPATNAFGFGCTGSPMGELFYGQLALSRGTPAVPTPAGPLGPFTGVQPYLYWSCGAPDPCQSAPAKGFEWSFSFGNGFQGTDIVHNDLYVMVYYPATTAHALADAVNAALGNNGQDNGFLTQAAAISSAPNAQAKTGALRAFINHVNAQRGKALTGAQADQLIALAEAI